MQTEWKSSIMAPADGPVFTRDEYNLLIEGEFLHRLGEGENLVGFIARTDDLLEELRVFIEDEDYTDEQDAAVAQDLQKKVAAHAGKWIFLA